MPKAPLLAAAAILVAATAGVPKLAKAIKGANPSPPTTTTQQPSNSGTTTGTKKAKRPKSQKSSAAEDFLNGWHKAYRWSTTSRIMSAASRCCARWATTTMPTSPLSIGYASRKLGRYDEAKLGTTARWRPIPSMR